MGVTDIISLLGGIALFLFGMSIMGEGLKKVAGNKLEVILYRLSSNAVKGILLGTGVTAVIQSSSATSVMVVGFVNSGMMKVKQAIGIILGAILGTSITGWILCLNSVGGSGASVASFFNTATLTGVVALIGIILRMFSKKQVAKNVGEILLGFGVLMYGMSAMSSAVAPLKESAEFIAVLTKFSNPFLGILVGLLFTAVLQSASATVGILQALAVTGAISFEIALPLIMGIGIGASVPVLLSALGASVNGKRTAFAYLFIDFLGAVICGIVFYSLNAIFHFSFMSMEMSMVSIALVNTIFRLVTLLILAPAIGLMEKIVCRLFPDSEESIAEQADMDRLEPRFYDHPAMAVEQSRMVIISMAEKTRQNLTEAIELRGDFSKKKLQKVIDLESVVDRYEDKLGNYLTKITGANLSKELASDVGRYLQVLTDFERISDHSRNIGEAIDETVEKKLEFSEEAKRELGVLERAVGDIVDITFNAFINDDSEEAMKVEPFEEVVDEICDEMKAHHVDRLQDSSCTLTQGFVFNDLITNYERISDHCSNIAFAIIQSGLDDVNEHEYLDAMKHAKDTGFEKYYEEFREKYGL